MNIKDANFKYTPDPPLQSVFSPLLIKPVKYNEETKQRMKQLIDYLNNDLTHHPIISNDSEVVFRVINPDGIIIQYLSDENEVCNHMFWSDQCRNRDWCNVSWYDLLMRKKVKKIIAKFKVKFKVY